MDARDAHEVDPFDEIEAWQDFLVDRACMGESNAYADVPLGPDSVFLYQSTTSPLPCATHAGLWMSFPGTKQMINYLRFCCLPSMWSIWLCREEWDDMYDPGGVDSIDLTCLFNGARRDGNRHCVDIPRMERIVRLLDQGTWEALDQAVRLFNRRWRSTPTWDFSLKIFRTPVEMGRHLLRHDACADVRHSKWLATCREAATSPQAAAAVADVLALACSL